MSHYQLRLATDADPRQGTEAISTDEARAWVETHHYLHSYPSGWTAAYKHHGAVVVFAFPANKNLESFLYERPVGLRELSRLYAPDGHPPNLLTDAIARAARAVRFDYGVEALVSYADPNQGHHGGVYQAASWLYTGQSEETRTYFDGGVWRARRSFHSGTKSRIPDVPMRRLAGKYRYTRPLTKRARRGLKRMVLPYPKPECQAIREAA